MLNSSEEISYWYLRLNGFFLLDNFVIHKSKDIDHSSDADLLALRTPFVYEEIGGQKDDWDKDLMNNFDDDSLIGIICQVKGGAIGSKELFREPYLSYNVQRLGLSKLTADITDQLRKASIASFTNDFGHKCQLAKLLITRDQPPKETNYIWFDLDYVYRFIHERINKYPKEKYADRNFFSSIGLQTIIEMNELNRKNTK